MIDARDGVRTEWVLPDLDGPDGPDGYRSIADIVSNFTMVEALKAQLEAWSMSLLVELHTKMWSTLGHDDDPCDPDPMQLAGDEIAPAMHWSPVTATNKVARALEVIGDLPTTYQALRDGRLDMGKVIGILEESRGLDHTQLAEVEDRIYPDALELTPAAIRNQVKAAVLSVDPDGAAERRRGGLRDRGVHQRLLPDGTGHLSATMSEVDAAAINALLTRLANAWKTTGDPRGINARRSDALVRTILGRDPDLGPENPDQPPPPPPPPPGQWPPPDTEPDPEPADNKTADPEAGQPDAGDPDRPDVEPPADQSTADQPAANGADQRIEDVLIGERGTGTEPDVHTARTNPDLPWIATSAGTGPGPVIAWHQQHGPIPLALAAHLITGGHAVAFEPLDHTAATITGTGHDPPPRLADYITRRDQHCRFPGCRRRATSCDQDHTTPWPDGPTTATNLACLCRRHHRTKQHWTYHTAWGQLRRIPTDNPHNAVLEWRTPAGRRYQTTAPTWPGDPNPTTEPFRARPDQPTRWLIIKLTETST